MRLLLLADSLGNGGLERQLALVATRLPDAWERRVWVMAGGPFEAYLRDRGVAVTVQERRFRLDPTPAAALWHELRAWRPHVVHSWSWMSTLAAGPACRLLRIPLIDGSIQTGALQPDFLRLKRTGMLCADRIVANSHAGLQAWGAGPAKGRVVYSGFDLTRLSALEGATADEGRPFTLVMTGRMVPVKHYDVVIEAARALSRESTGWRFLLVGAGPDRERLIRRAGDLIDAGTVEFPEPRMEVLSLVREAHVGVLMTNPRLAQEGCSNSILEYMACELPVVCGDGGGNRELVVDGATGFVVPPADPDALAERIAYLRQHDRERIAMGAAGKARLLANFTLQSALSDLERLYDDAMGRQH